MNEIEALRRAREEQGDILLTDEEIAVEREKAHKAWLPESGTVPWAWFWQRWLLRTQLKNVAGKIDDIVGQFESPPWLNDGEEQRIYDQGIKAAAVCVRIALEQEAG